jgi:hypothetical protein
VVKVDEVRLAVDTAIRFGLIINEMIRPRGASHRGVSLVPVPFTEYEYDLSPRRLPGGVAEWSKATVLKTVARKRRGFESLLLLNHSDRAMFFSDNPERWPSRSKAAVC